MPFAISRLASGLKLMTFQGMTLDRQTLIMATLEGDLLRIAADGTITSWVNVERYGIPTGIVNQGEAIAVVISAQESGHFLLKVSASGKITVIADLSELTGEFGAPFDVAVHGGYYPYYLVAISTDVVGTGGLVARVTPTGQVSVLAKLPSSPFGIVTNGDRVVITQENGQLIEISGTGKMQTIADLSAAGLGMPLGIALDQADYWVTTTSGQLVQVSPSGTLTPIADLLAAGLGAPTTLTSWGRDLIVATRAGYLLRLQPTPIESPASQEIPRV